MAQVTDIKIDEQARFDASGFEIGDQLSRVNGQQLFDRLQFKNYTPFNDDIGD